MKKSAYGTNTADKAAFPASCREIKKYSEKPDPFFHFHKHTEILYLTEGKLNISLNSKQYTLQKNEFIIINPHEAHCLSSVTAVSTCIVIKFTSDIINIPARSIRDTQYILPFMYTAENNMRVYNRDFCVKSGIPEIILDALNEFNKKNTGFELSLTADILKIIRCAVGYLCENGYEAQVSPSFSNIQHIISPILGYINENFRSCDEKKAAEAFSISYSYFSRSFKQVMNMSFNEYVNFLKVNEAKKLLLTTEKSVTEIAEELGFSSPSHFINVFRKHNSISPKQYKKS